ncbi:MAG: TonB-dependent receptor plug domain-containing protein, partial [Saprospiraceae bacterium]
MKNLLLLLSLLLATPLVAQNDSTLLLAPERLRDKDILTRDPGLRPTVAISATRGLEEVDQLPWSVWVITAEDIQRYGMVTLGDVLKAAPGIRVSSSGNALEGEKFLVRGLSGNKYVKVLINDVPIKPTVATGMSIGAQLPIRQAERIEVLYGPASSIYGGDACAGVVNIILKESERPVFTSADISFGGDGYNSLDVMCGGKLGKDKKIFRFSVYGSSTLRERTDIFYDQKPYNLDTYLPPGLGASLYRQNPNFLPADTTVGNLPKTAPAGHESRMFGISLNYRSLHFNYLRMGRSDYSSLGLNPLALSWSNPSDRLIERTETYSLNFQHTRRHWVSNTSLSVLNYRISNTSTTTYIFDRLSVVDFQFERQQ